VPPSDGRAVASLESLRASLADRYRLERELGQGGMATVYLAADLKHDRQVAIKVLKPELAAVLGAERFVQEIKTTAALSHPHILPLFDSGEAEGFLYYVMPFIEGETIREKLNRETQFGIEEAVRITTEVADALDYAHRHGVIHRDIKPENILLHDGRPMVMDFGIALAVSAAAGGRMTETGLSLGTPHYMSPEQATADKQITARSDIYSLASVLYEMLTGESPHMGNSAQQIIMKIVTDVPRPVTDLRKNVPPNVAMAIAKALEKLPADRFDSAKHFSSALADPSATFATTRIGAPATTPRGRERVAWIVAAAAVLALVILAVRLARTSGRDDAGPSWLVDLALPDSASFLAGLALSADGAVLTYGGPDRVWRRGAGAPVPAAIAGTDGGCCPSISPDGKEVAFLRGHAMYVVPLQGGTPRLMGNGFAGGDEIAWTSGGYLVAAREDSTSLGLAGLWRVRASGGEMETFATPDTARGELAFDSPHALPDGRGVVFTIVPRALSGSDARLRIGVVGPDGGSHTDLMPGRAAWYAEPGYLLVTGADGQVTATRFDPAARRLTGQPVPVFSVPPVPSVWGWTGYLTVARTGALVYVGAGERSHVEVAWVGRAGQVAPADFDASIQGASVGLSADGRIVVIGTTGLGAPPHLEIRDRASGAFSRVSPPGAWLGDPFVSADGRMLVYVRFSADSAAGVYRAEVSRPGAATRLLADVKVRFPSLSADGRTLYYDRSAHNGGYDLVARSLDDSGSTERVVASGSTVSRPSPDGKWVAFIDSTSGQAQLFIRSTDPGRSERWLLSSSAQGPVEWAPGGREIFFFDSDSLKAAPVTAAATVVVGPARRLFTMRRATVLDYAPEADGRFLFLRATGSHQTHLMMLSDWRRLLPSR
jgi:eukaryotic-like serine/threonine-protein kinase